MVKNYMEICVDDVIKNIFKSGKYSDLCMCEQCVDDIKAKALNNIKPYYITTREGEIFAECDSLENQNRTEIFIEVTKAVELVIGNKHHNNFK